MEQDGGLTWTNGIGLQLLHNLRRKKKKKNIKTQIYENYTIIRQKDTRTYLKPSLVKWKPWLTIWMYNLKK